MERGNCGRAQLLNHALAHPFMRIERDESGCAFSKD
jgi:hypothetical protein